VTAGDASAAPDTHVQATFCFIDIVGYTALTDYHGDLAAADLIGRFNDLVRGTVEPVGHVQELAGDNAFVVFPNPLLATRSLALLYRQVADQADFPVVRAGLHHGAALYRAGRYFGSTVNIAARVAAQATSGEILCTRAVVDLLAHEDTAGMTVQQRGSTRLRNLPQAVDLYAIVLAGPARRPAIDPVCQMQVDPRRAAADTRFDGKTYWFCSRSCAEQFAQHPSSYV